MSAQHQTQTRAAEGAGQQCTIEQTQSSGSQVSPSEEGAGIQPPCVAAVDNVLGEISTGEAELTASAPGEAGPSNLGSASYLIRDKYRKFDSEQGGNPGDPGPIEWKKPKNGFKAKIISFGGNFQLFTKYCKSVSPEWADMTLQWVKVCLAVLLVVFLVLIGCGVVWYGPELMAMAIKKMRS